MTHAQLEEELLKQPKTWLDYPFGDGIAVYKVGNKTDGKSKMFAIVEENSKPPKVSLKCDPVLADTLRQKYESVMPGYHLNKKHWNTIVLTGQLDDEQIKSLILHSFLLVKG